MRASHIFFLLLLCLACVSCRDASSSTEAPAVEDILREAADGTNENAIKVLSVYLASQ